MYELTGVGDDDEELDSVKAGDEVDLQRVIRSARWIRNLDDNHINGVINGLRTVLVGMEKVKDTAGALNLFNKIKDEQ